MKEIIAKNLSIGAETPSFRELLEAYNHYEYYGKIMAMIYVQYISKKELNDNKIVNDFLDKRDTHGAIFYSLDTNEKFKNQMKFLINNVLSVDTEKSIAKSSTASGNSSINLVIFALFIGLFTITFTA